MTGFKSKRQAALDEEGMYLVHQTAQPAQQEPVENRFVRELREYAKLNADIPLFPLWNARRALKYLDGYTALPAQPAQEQNFCSRCGKRTNDIHTCTPPQENT